MTGMRVNLFTLSFDADDSNLEEKFLATFYRNSLWHNRIAFLAGCILYGVFGLLDALLIPEQRGVFWIIRYTMVCPLILIAFAGTYTAVYEKRWQAFVALVVLAAAGGIIAMISLAPDPISSSYYAGLILVLIYSYTFVRYRFVWATCIGWLIVVMYEVVAIGLIDTPVPQLINNNFFFITANVLGMVACYWTEFYSRKNFYLLHLLENEKSTVTTINRDLEKKIEELRTASNEIRVLGGLLPICAHCKNIRDDKGYWKQLEEYISIHSDAEFTHSLCPICARKLYPELDLDG
jgi:hypothetical protein